MKFKLWIDDDERERGYRRGYDPEGDRTWWGLQGQRVLKTWVPVLIQPSIQRSTPALLSQARTQKTSCHSMPRQSRTPSLTLSVFLSLKAFFLLQYSKQINDLQTRPLSVALWVICVLSVQFPRFDQSAIDLYCAKKFQFYDHPTLALRVCTHTDLSTWLGRYLRPWSAYVLPAYFNLRTFSPRSKLFIKI